MPSYDLFLYFQSDLTLLRSWYLPGTHYSQTLEDWLRLLDKNGKKGLKELEKNALEKGHLGTEGTKTYHRYDFEFSTWHVQSCLTWTEESSGVLVTIFSRSSKLEVLLNNVNNTSGHYM